MRRIVLGLALALMASAASSQTVQTGSVFWNGTWGTPQPTTQYLQSCNGGLGGIVGQGSCTASSGGGGGVVTNAGTFAVQNTAATPAGTNGIGYVIQPTVTLLSNASATGSAVTNVPGGAYALNLSGTFGGTTVGFVSTINGVSTTTNYTSAPATPPCVTVGQGTTLQATVTGGTPSGLNFTLNGTGSCPSSSTLVANRASQATSSVAVNVSSATTAQLVALSSGKAIYISAMSMVVGAADNVTLEYGTGTNCGTGTTVLTGAYNFAANGGISQGNGDGAFLFVPASNALCVLTSTSAQLSGAVSYAQY